MQSLTLFVFQTNQNEGYNHAIGVNSGTNEARNKIVVLQKPTGGPDGYGASLKLAELEEGESYFIKGVYYNAWVTYEYLSIDKRDATISVLTTDLSSICEEANMGVFQLDLIMDQIAPETSWSLTQQRSNGNVVVASSGDAAYENNKKYFLSPIDFSGFCLTPDTVYTFTMMDGYGGTLL
jgi:hypothetical protein